MAARIWRVLCTGLSTVGDRLRTCAHCSTRARIRRHSTRIIRTLFGTPRASASPRSCGCCKATCKALLPRALFEPGIFSKLTEAQLKQLPNLAMSGRDDAVRLMVELGWPIATRGGDIDGSALNWAVFRGRPELAEFLLEHGASFREQHGYGSDVLGTLCWASLNTPRSDGDWPGCAAVLLEHGLPAATALPESEQEKPNRTVLIDGRKATLPPDVADVLLGAGT